jgi:hypothetical protein
MPAALQRYWLAGKGAAKIRWHMPHDFDRCVRNLRKYFPKNPEGLCNILHQKAVGAPPGKGHGHSLTASMTGTDDMASLVAAQMLLDKQPKLGKYLWAGPLAPIGRPTGEPRRTRIFEPGALNHRTLPLPLDWREKTGQGHEGSVTVGRILGITYGPDHDGKEYAWGWGDYLDEEDFPAARKARILAEGGVAGPSLDPGGKVMVTVNPETGFEHMTLYGIGGATLVSVPAFASLRQTVFSDDGDWPDDDPDMAVSPDDDCGCSGSSVTGIPTASVDVVQAPVFAVNTSGWRGLPLAARDAVFDNDDAVKRIAAWASVGAEGTSVDKLRRAFMWHDPQLPPTDPTSYRLPVGDVINGRLTLIFHAIYAAAALLSGAHGGLPSIGETDRAELRSTISEIYPEMARAFNDSSIRAPWDRSAAEGVQLAMEFATTDEGYPLAPPKAWFENPGLARKTKLTVTDDGRVFGHLAAWNECHRDVTMRECVLAPHSEQGYAPFHLGTVLTAEGDTVDVGKIVQDTRHAHIGLNYAAAALHYDNTGDEVAVVRAGEDEFGIWVAGSVVPEATKKKVAKLRRSPLSGDWRREKGSLELTAALAVNAPAFPVYAMEDDERLALVAAGSVWTDDFFVEDEPVADVLAAFNAGEKGFTAPPTGIVAVLEAAVADQFATERAQRLADLMEDEEIYAARERAERLQLLFAVDAEMAAQPPAVAPAPAAPIPAAPAASGGGEQMAAQAEDPTAIAISEQANARFATVPETGVEAPETVPTGPATPAAPAPAAPAPAVTPAPAQ